MKNIYVGNLDFDVSEDELRRAFGAYGQVDNVTILKDRDTGQPRGLGFVEMTEDEEAGKAIIGSNVTPLSSHVLNVNEARPNVNQGGAGFGGGGRGGFGGGRGGDRGGRGGGGGFRNRYCELARDARPVAGDRSPRSETKLLEPWQGRHTGVRP